MCAYAVEHACISGNWSQNRKRQYISIIESDGFNWLLLAHNSMQACNRAHRLKGACTSSIANRTREGQSKNKGEFLKSGEDGNTQENVVWKEELNIPLSAIDGAARLSSVVGPLGAVTGSQSGSAGVGGARAGIARRVVGRHRVEGGSH